MFRATQFHKRWATTWFNFRIPSLEYLSTIDVELTNQQGGRVRSNNVDEVTTIQATEEWTRFCDALPMNMFAIYQARWNFI